MRLEGRKNARQSPGATPENRCASRDPRRRTCRLNAGSLPRDAWDSIGSAPGFHSGIGDDRQRDLSLAVMRHAPAEADRLLIADQIIEEAERVESGLSKIKPAFYAEVIAAGMNTHVDVEAPFTTGPIVNAEQLSAGQHPRKNCPGFGRGFFR